MRNALVDVRFTLDLPEPVIESLVGSSDDGTDEWRERALDTLDARLKDEFHHYLDYMTGGEPDVEADG